MTWYNILINQKGNFQSWVLLPCLLLLTTHYCWKSLLCYFYVMSTFSLKIRKGFHIYKGHSQYHFLKRKTLKWLLKYEKQNFLNTRGDSFILCIKPRQPGWKQKKNNHLVVWHTCHKIIYWYLVPGFTILTVSFVCVCVWGVFFSFFLVGGIWFLIIE